MGKESTYSAGDRTLRLDSRIRKFPRRTWQPGNPLCIPAWKIPRTEEPGGLQSLGSQRVGHWWINTHTVLHFRGSNICIVCFFYFLVKQSFLTPDQLKNYSYFFHLLKKNTFKTLQNFLLSCFGMSDEVKIRSFFSQILSFLTLSYMSHFYLD